MSKEETSSSATSVDTIDTDFDFCKETNSNDPDPRSYTLQKYHKLLWSKPLPNGKMFSLELAASRHLKHSSELGSFELSSDSITHTYSRTKWKSMQQIVSLVPKSDLDVFYHLACTIGGFTVFPSGQVGGCQSINQARGTHPNILDRFDISLECIRLYYKKARSPLYETLCNYSSFFDLFVDFKGYVDFFLLQDLVFEDYSGVKAHIPFNSGSPLPRDLKEYTIYMKSTVSFLHNRNHRIQEWVKESFS